MRDSKSSCLIETPDGWYFRQPSKDAQLLVTRGAAPTELVDSLQSLSVDLKKCQLDILMDARSLLFSQFNLEDVGGSRARSSLLFRLEADLPVSAEELLADFRISGDGSVAAVAVEKQKLLPLVSALAELEVRIRCILPASMAAAQALVESQRIPSTCLMTLLYEHSMETILLQEATVRSWRLAPQGHNLEHDLRLLTASVDPQPEEFVVGSRERLAEWSNERGAKTVEAEIDRFVGDKSAAITDTQRAWFNLAKDPAVDATVSGSTAQRFRNTAAIVATCLLVIAAACAWRAARLRGTVGQVREQTQRVFRETFPEARMPSAVVARLKSEHTKVVASRAAGGRTAPRTASALPVLDRLLLGLPETVEMSVREIRIQDGEIYLELDINSHADAGVVAESLQRQGMLFSPPTTENLNDHVQAVLRGRVAEGASS